MLTYLDNKQKKKKNLFRYDRRLTNKPEIKVLVTENWNQNEDDSVLSRLCRIRQAIVKWSKEQNKQCTDNIQKLQQDLDSALSSSVPDTDVIGMLTAELNRAYTEEESYWRQRSRVLWLQHGDKNTSYFHAITRGRHAANKFSVIENQQGTPVYDEDQIAATIVSYYNTLFTSSSASDPQLISEAITHRVSDSSNALLIHPPDDLEIREAVFAIHGDKAPGPDGFSANFFQGFWDIVGEEVCRDIKSFFSSSTLLRRHNETHVRLIPKIKSPKTVLDYRPIALCSTHYKIIAKILCRRLKPILSDIISPHQSAFVAGRSISDNVLLTHEILHYLRTSKAKKHCSMAVKTDMSKAYDRLEWSFLRNVLNQFGFHPTWIGWIMECVCSVSYSFLINGSAKGQVIPSRGIRQGDPLSPYLFILCSEVLSGLCLRAQEQGKVQGIRVARRAPALNHLLFADDTMFFCRSDQQTCRELALILERYEAISGQCINLLKSAITFSAKTPIGTRRRVKEILKIEGEGGAGKYLGLPEYFNRKKRDIFAGIVDRIRQRSHSWATRFLNAAGKQVLLKAVLAAMPSHAMSCFKIPVSLCKQIQTILMRFWWDAKPNLRKMAWVSWARMTMPKFAGGLGFREIEQFNDALLAKLAWRILKCPHSLLGQILLGKYCNASAFLQATAPQNASHGWRGIMAGKEVLLKGLGWIVGSGENINIWNDPWLATDKPTAPIGPPTAANRNLHVSDLIHTYSNEWNLSAIREHLPQYEAQIRALPLSQFSMVDEWVWLPEKSGVYSTKTGYALCKKNTGESDLEFNWQKLVWSVKTSPKLKHFLWKIKSKAIPVGENLLRRGLEVDGTCKRCGILETERHVFSQCSFSTRTWELVPALHTPLPGSIASPSDLLRSCGRMINLPPTGLYATDLFPWVLWYLWIARNKLVFENVIMIEQEVVSLATKEARAWQSAQVAKTSLETSRKSHNLPQPCGSSHTTHCYVDAAWNATTKGGGFGCIFKDPSTSNLIHQVSGNRCFVGSAFIAEAIAVKTALLEAVNLGLRTLIIWSDSQSLISTISLQKKSVEAQGVLFDIAHLCSFFSCISFRFVPRLGNAEADCLAKQALLNLSNSV